MASHAASAPDPDRRNGEDDRLPVLRSKLRVAPPGNLGVTEILFDRAGGASPFGDDVRLPLPVSELTYVHPTPDAFPEL